MKSLKKIVLKNSAQKNIYYYHTGAGTLELVVTDAIERAQFVERIENNDAIGTTIITNKFSLIGTDFQIKVWNALLRIPCGQTTTYQLLAHNIGYPTAWRAVANAVGANPIAYFIPCHRVVRKNGELGGYRWGIEKKRLLLKAENAI